MGADTWCQRPVLMFSAGTSARRQICWLFLPEGFVLADVLPPHLAKRTDANAAFYGAPHC